MKKITMKVLAVIALLSVVPALFAQNVTIDAKVNVLTSDTTNYFNWTLGKKTVKDKLDAASGASVAKSTAEFNSVRYDTDDAKKAAIPVALRGFVLYPVADYKTLTDDALTVAEDGKALTVHFVHRGVAYELKTDKNGDFNVLTGAKFAKGLADNVGGEFVLKAEFTKAGGDPKKMSSLDWSKVTLVPDAKDPAATRWYEGTLRLELKKGILTAKGNLTEKK
jgi:hypothetical protein